MTYFQHYSINEHLFNSTVEENEDPSTDAAEYLFKHSKYQDYCFTVGNPEFDKVERIGVVSSHLVAHSPVFRAMLKENDVGEQKININNVSPKVFKLLLIHLYGGTLPAIDRLTMAQLALCAGMYKVMPLVAWACQNLVPTSVEDVFPALWCVSYMSCPAIEPQVTKIIQEETDAVLNTNDFLDLDSKCLDFIAKQDKLAISELDLWKALVRWAMNKADADPAKTMREHLQTTLQYVRLTTLSQDEIIKDVMPINILSPVEMMDLLTAVTSNKPWEFPGLCKTQKVRELSDVACQQIDNSSTSVPKEDTPFQNTCIYKSEIDGETNHIIEDIEEYQPVSILTIKTLKEVEIESFTFKSRSFLNKGTRSIYKLSCTITISKIEAGFCKDTRIIQVGGSVVCDEFIAFPLKLRNGQLPRLDADSLYNVALEFSVDHPVYRLKNADGAEETFSVRKTENDQMTVKFNTVPHLRHIKYRV